MLLTNNTRQTCENKDRQCRIINDINRSGGGRAADVAPRDAAGAVN